MIMNIIRWMILVLQVLLLIIQICTTDPLWVIPIVGLSVIQILLGIAKMEVSVSVEINDEEEQHENNSL